MLRAVAVATLVLVFPAAAAGDIGLIVHRSVAAPGEELVVYGPCGGMRVYLVPGASRRPTTVVSKPPAAPLRPLGRLRCTGRVHVVGDVPRGDWTGWSAILVDDAYVWRGGTRVGPTELRVSSGRRR